MIAETVDYLEAIERLPRSGTLVLYSVPWEEYTEVLAQTENKPAYRVSYNDGILKIMSPRPKRERLKDSILDLATIYADELNIMLESYGSTTYRQRKKAKGAEPDTSFYVQKAARLSAQLLTEYLNLGKTAGQTAMLKAFRRFLRNEI